MGAGSCQTYPKGAKRRLSNSGFRHRLGRLHRGADWREREEIEKGGDRRAIIELAPVKQFTDLAEGNPRQVGWRGQRAVRLGRRAHQPRRATVHPKQPRLGSSAEALDNFGLTLATGGLGPATSSAPASGTRSRNQTTMPNR